MLGIQRLSTLAELVGFSEGELRLTAEFAESFVTPLTAWDPVRKPRAVISVHGPLRAFQEQFYKQVLRPRIRPSRWSFGAVKGRHLVNHAQKHVGSIFVYKADLSNFYPSIGIDRVNRHFLKALRCSPEVSKFLTRLCTYDFHLALGLITSPVLANQLMHPIDARIGALCEAHHCVYTRWVDDITISAQWDLSGSKVPEKVNAILASHGLAEKASKRDFGRLENGPAITGIRIRKGKIDVTEEFLVELHRQLSDHAALAMNGQFAGPFQSYSQLAGRVNFAAWVNPGRGPSLQNRLRSINWKAIEANAIQRGLVVKKKIVTKRGVIPPEYASESRLGMVEYSSITEHAAGV